VLPNKAPEGKHLIYFPYWRSRGMFFSCGGNGITDRYADMSHQAVKSDIFPVSVGLRSQALKLKFASRAHNGHYLKPAFPLKQVLEIFKNHLSMEALPPIFHQDYINESLSLIYSPFYMDEKIIDAVLNEPLRQDIPENFDLSLFPGESPDWKINFLPTLCPNCGWDMEGEKDSLALFCRNCNSLWQPEKNGFTKLDFSTIPMAGNDIVHLPFWRIKAKISGVKLDNYSDLVKTANLPKVVQKGWDEMDFRFWVMGFKVRPQKFLSIVTGMTLAQPQEKMVSEFPSTSLLSLTFPLKEAVKSLKLCLAGFIKPQRPFFTMMRDVTVTPKSYRLVYVPFREKQHEFISPEYRLAIIKNHLAMARNL
jgi:hypothetical protein